MAAKSKAKGTHRFALPDDFKFPEIPDEMAGALEDAIREIVNEYLPPEWAAVISDYAAMYSVRPGDVGNSLADFAEWVDNLNKLQMFLAGVRYDKTGHRSEWVGPAPKLGKAGK